MFKSGESFSSEETKSDTSKGAIDRIFYDIQSKVSEIRESSEYYTTYEERFNRTPVDGERGGWTGARAESTYVPADADIRKQLSEHGLEGIPYKNGEAHFEKVAKVAVTIDMTSERSSGGYGETRKIGNFEKADTQCAKLWNEQGFEGKNNWSARDVANWRNSESHKYTWHECCDTKTCLLVKEDIHGYFPHSGGCKECSARDVTKEKN